MGYSNNPVGTLSIGLVILEAMLSQQIFAGKTRRHWLICSWFAIYDPALAHCNTVTVLHRNSHRSNSHRSNSQQPVTGSSPVDRKSSWTWLVAFICTIYWTLSWNSHLRCRLHRMLSELWIDFSSLPPNSSQIEHEANWETHNETGDETRKPTVAYSRWESQREKKFSLVLEMLCTYRAS